MMMTNEDYEDKRYLDHIEALRAEHEAELRRQHEIDMRDQHVDALEAERDALRAEVERLKASISVKDDIRAHLELQVNDLKCERDADIAAAVEQERARIRRLAFGAPFGMSSEHILFEYLHGSEERRASIIVGLEGPAISEPPQPAKEQ